ncbi:flagellar biosynthesis anti-sigma factor FlgM [Sphingomonas sp. AOB5]|uniref:flagellar biosynthesis anti-sigma factor FlgM n=1 Tax=Sphingomonas sp. AOB5 TaxID=3034017 RepID=UPI0023F931E3|nr:flagellar biosynthesis anti-sigma factor FlgM [Sphingomonas sp. AOB5]MDF7777299.1 flagellar biosynthesis anti-sigma factor FlgM [Sphingomonas sp. AOB5]
MVDPIGIKAASVALSQRSSAVVATQAAAAPKAVMADAKTDETVQAAELTSAMASSAPVDAERVARIKRAIEDGNFPLVPSTVADRLLALKLEWNPNDAA